jgi:hypothetical protein
MARAVAVNAVRPTRQVPRAKFRCMAFLPQRGEPAAAGPDFGRACSASTRRRFDAATALWATVST